MPELFAEREVLDIEANVLVVVVPEGEGTADLSLPPSKYGIRYENDESWEVVELLPNASVEVSRYGVRFWGTAAKSAEWQGAKLRSTHDTRAGSRWVARIAVGASRSDISFPGFDVSSGAVALTLAAEYSITERLRWVAPLPLLSYRFGRSDTEGVSAKVWGGVTNIGVGYNGTDGGLFLYAFGLGADVGYSLHPSHSFVASTRATTGGLVTANKVLPDEPPNTIRATLAAGYRYRSKTWRFSLGASFAGNPMAGGRAVKWSGSDDNFDFRVSVGSVNYNGPFPEPLVSFVVNQRFSLDGYLAIGIPLRRVPPLELYLVGATVSF